MKIGTYNRFQVVNEAPLFPDLGQLFYRKLPKVNSAEDPRALMIGSQMLAMKETVRVVQVWNSMDLMRMKSQNSQVWTSKMILGTTR